ncbi:MAG TPA: hypothetical protein VLG11_01100 [Candidatus Saccharimonadales bacterium]|nr:hypothetical protein [Candidatus Saccharimonadales bacterium]
MARLPIPGSDNGTWGTVLNDFLAVEHNSDGTLKSSGTISTKANDSAVVHNTGDENVAGIKTFASSPVVPTPTTSTQAANKTYVDSVASSGAPDATTSTKGILQLAGDLAGTATSPSVAKVNGVAVSGVAGSGLVLTASSSSAASWTALPRLDQVTAPTASVSLNSQKIINLANGTAATDAAAFGQIPVAGTTAGTYAAGNDSRITGAEQTANKGAANGYAPLNSSSKVPTANLPLVFPPVTLTDAATIATDASQSNQFRVTLGGNRTLGNPTNPTDGQKVMWEIIQDGTGSRTLTLDTAFALGTDISSITLTTTAGKRDFLGAVYNSGTSKWYVIAFVKGY